MVKYKYEKQQRKKHNDENCRKAISQAVPFSRQDDLLKKIEADIMADIRQRWMHDVHGTVRREIKDGLV